MNPWIIDMLKTWGHVVLLGGSLFILVGLLLIVRELVVSRSEQKAANRRLHDRIMKYASASEATAYKPGEPQVPRPRGPITLDDVRNL